jgi:hypothetical protein
MQLFMVFQPLELRQLLLFMQVIAGWQLLCAPPAK